VAISLDDVATLKRFRESIGAPFPFLSDPDGRVSRLYAGVSLHTANRVTVDIDSDGTIAQVRQGVGRRDSDSCLSGTVGRVHAAAQERCSQPSREERTD
jgi:peroxiredoxin